MNKFKYLPMATVGISALVIMLVIIITGHNFEGGVSAVALGATLLAVTVISKKLREVTVLFYLSASLLFSGILMISVSTCSVDVAKSVSGDDAVVVATVTGESESYPSKSVYVLDVESVNGVETDVKFRLSVNSALNVYAGDEITFTADVYSVDSFDKSLKRYYMSEGIYLGANLYDKAETVVVTKDGSHTVKCKLQLLRDEIKSRIYSVLPNEYGAVAVAMLLGDKSAVSDETLEALRGSGIYHLFAVSGLHLSIWVLGFFSLLKKLGIHKKLNSLMALLFTLLFMALTGFTPSVTRAGIMLLVLLCGNLVGRESDSLNSLGFSVVIILCLNPMAAVSTSLLLSFSATLGIVTLYPVLDKLTDKRLSEIKNKLVRKGIKGLVSILLVSVCAGIFTFPVNSIIFGEAHIIAPVTNLLITYAATAMLICAGGTVLLSAIPFGANFCGFFCGHIAKYIIYTASLMNKFPFAALKTDGVSFYVFILLLISCVTGCLLIVDSKRLRVKSIIASVISLSIIFSCVNIVYFHDLTTVKIMDVDDGICLVVKNKDKTAVIGCGGSDEYSYDSVRYEIYDKNPSLLIVPDNNSWNSLLLPELVKDFNFTQIVSGENISGCSSTVEPDFVVSPWKSASIEFHKNKEITYAYCVFDKHDMLIVFDCIDYGNIPENISADVLVCSYYLPSDADLSNFGKIIISSGRAVSCDMTELYKKENPNIYSTYGENDVTVSMRANKENINITYN